MQAAIYVNHFLSVFVSVSEDGDTPIDDSADHGHRDVVVLLLERGADPTMVRLIKRDVLFKF